MYACKYEKNNNVRHCISKITGIQEKDLNDSCINFWLVRAVEELRPFVKSIQNQGLHDMCEYIIKYEYIYKPCFKNEWQRVNIWLIYLLKGVPVRERGADGVWIEKYGVKHE